MARSGLSALSSATLRRLSGLIPDKMRRRRPTTINVNKLWIRQIHTEYNLHGSVAFVSTKMKSFEAGTWHEFFSGKMIDFRDFLISGIDVTRVSERFLILFSD